MQIERFAQRMIALMPQLALGFSRRVHRHVHHGLMRGRLTLPQLWAMEYLCQQDSVPMKEVADFLAISRPAATGLINRLFAQGLARRDTDRRDRRIVRVTITAQGRRIIHTVWDKKRKTLTEVFGQISPRDRAHYLATLERVIGILSQRPPARGRRHLAAQVR